MQHHEHEPGAGTVASACKKLTFLEKDEAHLSFIKCGVFCRHLEVILQAESMYVFRDLLNNHRNFAEPLPARVIQGGQT